MKKVKVSEATNIQIDWMVAKALGEIGVAPSQCSYCHHFEERAICDGAEFRCHLGDLSWCDGYVSDDPFGDGISAEYGIHEKCPLKAGTATEAYSTNWSQGGPIIEREQIQVWYDCGDWCAALPGDSAMDRAGDNWDSGPTPLIAAMRCYITSELGGEVEVPGELT